MNNTILWSSSTTNSKNKEMLRNNLNLEDFVAWRSADGNAQSLREALKLGYQRGQPAGEVLSPWEAQSEA